MWFIDTTVNSTRGPVKAVSLALMLQEFNRLYWRVCLLRADLHHYIVAPFSKMQVMCKTKNGCASGNLTVSDISQDKPPEQLSYSFAHILQVSL